MFVASSLVILSGLAMAVPAGGAQLTMTKVGGFTSTNDNPLEIVVQGNDNYLYAASASGVVILEIGADLSPLEIGNYTSMVDFGEPTSVAYTKVYDQVAISVKAHDALTRGRVYIVKSATDWIACGFCDDAVYYLEAGYLPDMVTFTPNGRRILTANEGSPLDYTIAENDPPGSVSIFKIESTKMYSPACEVGFERFNTEEATNKHVAQGVRVTGMNFTTFSMDMEPEYIAVTANSRVAYVTLQENNAVARINIRECKVRRVLPLGYQVYGDDVQFDPSDKDSAINVGSWPMVKGMYMPDSIATFQSGGQAYFVTANEGDSREYGLYVDEIRVKDLATELGLDATVAPYNDPNLGRLKVTTEAPFDGNIDELYAFGGRSFSIFKGKDGSLVWDSGDFIEQFTSDPANGFSSLFNSNGGVSSFDSRSDDKGAEPEGLAMTVIDGRRYVFVGLERIGGWMCWDVTDPTSPVFQSYANTYTEDSAPESATIIPADVSPSGKPLLVAAYEISNTLAVFELTIE